MTNNNNYKIDETYRGLLKILVNENKLGLTSEEIAKINEVKEIIGNLIDEGF